MQGALCPNCLPSLTVGNVVARGEIGDSEESPNSNRAAAGGGEALLKAALAFTDTAAYLQSVHRAAIDQFHTGQRPAMAVVVHLHMIANCRCFPTSSGKISCSCIHQPRICGQREIALASGAFCCTGELHLLLHV